MTEEKVNILISIPKKLEEDLRDLAQIIYPDKKRGGLSLTAEDAIILLANQSKYHELLTKYRQLREETEKLKQEILK